MSLRDSETGRTLEISNPIPQLKQRVPDKQTRHSNVLPSSNFFVTSASNEAHTSPFECRGSHFSMNAGNNVTPVTHSSIIASSSKSCVSLPHTPSSFFRVHNKTRLSNSNTKLGMKETLTSNGGAPGYQAFLQPSYDEEAKPYTTSEEHV